MSGTQPYIDLIRSQRNISQPLYLLVDPLETVDEDEAYSLESLENTLGKARIEIVPRADLIHTPADCPHLVLLAQAGEPARTGAGSILNATIEYARHEHPAERRYICGWLQSSLDLGQLAEVLAQRMTFASNTATIAVVNAADPSRANMRIYPVYEPLRQELIAYECHETHPDIHAQWLGEISQWIIPASNQGFLCFKAESAGAADTANVADAANATDAANTADSPVVLPQNAINAQIDAPLVANVLRMWQQLATRPISVQRQQQMPLLRRGPFELPQGAAYMALQQLHAAHRRGLTNMRDQMMFAIMRLTMHPRIEQHAVIQACIDRAIRGEDTLAAQIGAISHVQMMRILQELNA